MSAETSRCPNVLKRTLSDPKVVVQRSLRGLRSEKFSQWPGQPAAAAPTHACLKRGIQFTLWQPGQKLDNARRVTRKEDQNVSLLAICTASSTHAGTMLMSGLPLFIKHSVLAESMWLLKVFEKFPWLLFVTRFVISICHQSQ